MRFVFQKQKTKKKKCHNPKMCGDLTVQQRCGRCPKIWFVFFTLCSSFILCLSIYKNCNRKDFFFCHFDIEFYIEISWKSKETGNWRKLKYLVVFTLALISKFWLQYQNFNFILEHFNYDNKNLFSKFSHYSKKFHFILETSNVLSECFGTLFWKFPQWSRNFGSRVGNP